MAVDEEADCGVTPRFFKIILEPRNDLQTLGIPPKFMTDHGSELVNVVTLEIPTGKIWKVELVRQNERAWFKDGWSEFVEYNSIGHGHFLMFSYQVELRFKVYIFDMTACEIDYPFVPQETSDEIPTTVSEVPEESSDEIQTTVSYIPEESSDGIWTTLSETTISEENISSPSSSSKEKRMVDLVRRLIMKQGTLFTANINKINACQFKIPAFTIIINPSYLKGVTRATIPARFTREHLKNAASSCILENATGGRWQVGITYRKRLTRIQKGWKMFACENELRLGDACVFELINAAKCVFRVEVVPCSSGVGAYARGVRIEDTSSEDDYDEIPTTGSDVAEETSDEMQTTVSNETMVSNDNLCSPTSSSKAKSMVDSVKRLIMKQGTLFTTNIKKINAGQFKIPAFTIIIKPSYLKGIPRATIPAGFTHEYLKKAQSSCIIKNATGNKWRVGIACHRPRLTRFQKGWRVFARENALRVGDACIFELINAAECVFRVEVVSCSSDVGPYVRGARIEYTSSDDDYVGAYARGARVEDTSSDDDYDD